MKGDCDMAKTKTICFCNNKGGSGKSTSCANIGFALASFGHKVLLIDGDMQLNLSLSFFEEDKVLEMAQSEKNLYYAIRDQKDLKDYIVQTPYENLDIIHDFSVTEKSSCTVNNAKGKEFEIRVAGESAEFTINVSREFKTE